MRKTAKRNEEKLNYRYDKGKNSPTQEYPLQTCACQIQQFCGIAPFKWSSKVIDTHWEINMKWL